MAACSNDPPSLDIEVDPTDFTSGLLEILAIIRPAWAKEDITCELMNQGMLNTMAVCYLKDLGKDQTSVVARMFGSTFREMLSSKDQELACSKCFAGLGLGPQVYCTFKNGICYEYLVGKSYQWTEISAFRDENLAGLVAKKLARYHCNASLEAAKKYGIGPAVDPYAASKMVLQAWPIPIKDPELNELFYKDMYSKEELTAAMERLGDSLKPGAFGMPEVLAHCDPNPTNIIFQEDRGDIIMVDFEMAGIETSIRDLGSYLFMSAFAIFDGDVAAKKHSAKYVKTFLRTYLEELKKLNGDKGHVSEDLVEKYFVLMEHAFLLFLIAAPIFVPQFCNTSDRIDPKIVVNSTLERLEWYKANKDRILSMKIPDV